MKKTAAAITAVAAALALICSVAAASTSAIWTQAGAATFFKGTLENMSLSSDGFLTLGLENETVLETTEPYIWSVAADRRGNIYAGSGNKAVLYRIDAKGGSQLAMLPGIGITALSPGADDEIVAGVFPTGEIRSVSSSGRDKLIATLPAQYIWALRQKKEGGFIAATGSPAGIYTISPKGESKNIARSPERHILCFDTDEKGNIYAGSSPNGLVYRIDAKTGKLSVVADFSEEEIYRILYIGNGRLLVAANRDQMPSMPQGGPGIPGRIGPDRPMPSDILNTPISFPAPYDTAPGAPPPVPSNLYLLKTTGETRRLFTFADPYILSLKQIDNNRFLVGTGSRGGLYTINIETLESTLDRLPARQILDIFGTDKNLLYFATGGPGSVFAFKNKHLADGKYTSPINDTYGVATWGKLWAEALVPEKSALEFQTRSGNTSDPDDGTWSDWATVSVKLPAQAPSPPARYIQYRATMRPGDAKTTPLLKEVNIAYLTSNRPPEILDIAITPAPQKRMPPPQEQPGQQNAQRGIAARTSENRQSDAPPESNIQVGTLTAGQDISIKWVAQDPDGDPLRHTLLFRRLPSAQWSTLAPELFGSEYRWQTESVPDGKYEIRLETTDAPANPVESAFNEFKISDPFIIDNSRPLITFDISQPEKGVIRISGSTTDPTSIISGIEYSLDDLKWKTVFPDDRIFDSATETFAIEISNLGNGSHTIIVRARDFAGNTSSQSMPFEIK